MDENTRQTTDTAGFKHQSSTTVFFKGYSHTDDHTRQAADSPVFKHQSPTTVFLRTTLTQTITLDKLPILLCSNISHQQQSF